MLVQCRGVVPQDWASLFDTLQFGAAGGGDRRWLRLALLPGLGCRVLILVGKPFAIRLESHAGTVFPGEDGRHIADGNRNITCHTAEARLESDSLIGDIQMPRCLVSNVEDDLAFREWHVSGRAWSMAVPRAFPKQID